MKALRVLALVLALLLVGSACTPEQEAWWFAREHEAEIRGDPCPSLSPSIVGAGLPLHFVWIVWRESRCQADAVNESSGTLGLTQIEPFWLVALCPLGIACTEAELLETRANLLAAAYVFAIQGYEAWSQTA